MKCLHKACKPTNNWIDLVEACKRRYHRPITLLLVETTTRKQQEVATGTVINERAQSSKAHIPLYRLPRDVRDKSATNSWRPL